MNLVFTEEADLQLRTLESDPTRDRELRAVNQALDLLARHPGDERCRQRRFSNGIWLMPVASSIIILWRPLGDEDQLVTYIGSEL